MQNFTAIIFLLAVLLSLYAIIDKLKLPQPVFLVLVGLLIGFIPFFPNLILDPEIIFIVFLLLLLGSAHYIHTFHTHIHASTHPHIHTSIQPHITHHTSHTTHHTSHITHDNMTSQIRCEWVHHDDHIRWHITHTTQIIARHCNANTTRRADRTGK